MKMRTKNSLRNIVVSFVGQFLRLFLAMIQRIFFIKILGTEYLGLDSLFSNILCILSLAELGIGQAITCNLYKPLKDNDIEKIKSLMSLYKKAYTIIGILIIISGFFISPFLKIFIAEMPNISENIYVIYCVFVLNTGISYFFSYKRELMNADQKMYITNIYIYSCLIIMNILQIVAMIVTKEYYLFLCIKIVTTIVENLLLSRKADKLYPFLKDKKVSELSKKEKKFIFKNVVATASYKLGDRIVLSTDNLLISKFVGLKIVGIYSNYYLIVNSLNLILGQFFSSIVASIGNLVSSENGKNSKIVFDNVWFANYCLYTYSSIILMVLFNHFISIWIGEKFLLKTSVVVLIVINFYLNGMRKTTLAFRDAMGLYWQGKTKPIIEAIINLIASILLAKKFGILGVILGTIISNLFINMWWEPLVLFKYGFKAKVRDFYFKMFFYSFLTLILGYIVYIISENIIVGYTIVNLIFKLLFSNILVIIVLIIFFGKKSEFNYYLELIKKIYKKILKKY